jgi:hypothetical protein
MTQVFFYEHRDYGGDDQTPVECGDCDWTGSACDLDGISDYEQRVSPGEPTPAGQCPKCAALAHIVEVTS